MKQEFKNIKYSGIEFVVPLWVNYITTDADGVIKAFEDEPEYTEDGIFSFWSNKETNVGQSKIIYQHVDSDKSLVKLFDIGE